VAALYGFFDESGKSHDHNVIVFSGFVGTWGQWESLDAEWQRLLRQNNITALHFKDHKKRPSLLKKFISIIKSEIEFGISVSVKVEDFRALPSHVQAMVRGDPFYLAFRTVVLRIMHHMISGAVNTLNFTCDEDEETAIPCYQWYKQIKRQMPEVKSRLISFCVADDKYLSQLQAADLMAALTRCEAEKIMLGRDSEAHQLFEYLALPEANRKLMFESMFLEATRLGDLLAKINEEIAKQGGSYTMES